MLDFELVTVLETGNPVILAVAKSLLEDGGIEYVVYGEDIQNLFGAGLSGVGFSAVTGPARVQVAPESESKAKELLKDLGEE